MFFISIFRGLWSLTIFGASIITAVWAWHDAKRLHLSPWLWAGISFSLFPLGFIIYLIYRVFKMNRV